MINAAQTELKKPSDTDSWGTSCLSPPFVCQIPLSVVPNKPGQNQVTVTAFCPSPPFVRHRLLSKGANPTMMLSARMLRAMHDSGHDR
jgi:hypothetical protein